MEDRNNHDECWESNSVDNGAESMEEVDELDVIMHDNINGGFEPCEPASGMSFPSKEAVKSFYRQYAFRMERSFDDGYICVHLCINVLCIGGSHIGCNKTKQNIYYSKNPTN